MAQLDLPNDHEPTLYASRKQIYPLRIKGKFRQIKWLIMAITLGIYYLAPFIRWDRGPNAPDQAILVDIVTKRLYFFMIEIWPQEFYYVTGLLVISALGLFLANALGGRLWCGYTCPQTVWTDLFMAVERFVEGDRRERMKLDAAPMSAGKLAKKTSKHILWLLIAMATGGAWVLYFADAPTLVQTIFTGQADFNAYLWIGIFTTTTYLLAGYAREQVCTYMCPWPRIQAALTDEWALNVTYRYDRGEGRAPLKRAKLLEAAGEKVGDCIDCSKCVQVCPTGVDIRDGLQLDCIQCGLCIDACDDVMTRIGRPTGLIAYDTDMNVERRQKGLPNIYRFVRARTVIYSALIVLVGGLMLYHLITRPLMDVKVQHDRNPLYVTLADGSVRNGYTVNLVNKRVYPRRYIVSFEGIEGVSIDVVGDADDLFGQPIIDVGPDQTHAVKIYVTAPKDLSRPSNLDAKIIIKDTLSYDVREARDFFHGPQPRK